MSDQRLIVALDCNGVEPAMQIVEALGNSASFFKIGLGLMPVGGLDLARRLMDEFGKRVFLDMKLFDIGSTVARATAGFCATGADFLTVHGDPHVVRAAVDGRGDHKTRILAVTVLTSLDRKDLNEGLIKDGTILEIAARRAESALAAGADGIICSPRETSALRRILSPSPALFVTPGIRIQRQVGDDQKRILDPAAAILAGADHIVVGRPIIEAGDPARVAQSIVADLPAQKTVQVPA